MDTKEAILIILASLILGFSVAFPNFSALFSSVIYMLIILVVNVASKKLAAYYFEAEAKIRFWEVYQFYWAKKSHFRRPLPMFWLSPILSLISLGYIKWMPILEFEILPHPERVSKRHGIYRFTEMTDTQVSAIAACGVFACLILAVIAYVAGFGTLTKLSVYFAAWSLLPFGSLDGTKILMGSRVTWMILVILSAVFFSMSVFIV